MYIEALYLDDIWVIKFLKKFYFAYRRHVDAILDVSQLDLFDGDQLFGFNVSRSVHDGKSSLAEFVEFLVRGFAAHFRMKECSRLRCSSLTRLSQLFGGD